MSEPRMLKGRLGVQLEPAPSAHVSVYGFAGWLKGEPMVAASLTVREARELAEDLLRTARIMEGRRGGSGE